MRRAHVRNAVITQKFFFREFVAPPELKDCYTERAAADWENSLGNEVR